MLVGVGGGGVERERPVWGGGEGDTFDTPLFLLSLLLCLSVSLVMSPVEAHYLHSAFIQTINYVIYEQWSPHFTLLSYARSRIFRPSLVVAHLTM